MNKFAMILKKTVFGVVCMMTVSTVLTVFTACSKDDSVVNLDDSRSEDGKSDKVKIVTGQAVDITDNGATLSGTISLETGAPDMVGVLIGETQNLSVTNNLRNLKIDNPTTGAVSKSVAGLSPNTTYYYTVYILFADKYYYGEKLSFTTLAKKDPLAKITLLSRDGMHIKLQYDVADEVAYFKYGRIGNSYTFTEKKKKSTTLNWDDLSPAKSYRFTLSAYDANDNILETVSEDFETESSPYSNYVCYNGKFYAITSGTMSNQYGYSGTNTGTNWKFLTLYVGNGGHVQFSYGVHEWEDVTPTWLQGTYNITASSSYYEYNGYYYGGKYYTYFDEGKLVIKTKTGMTTIDFDCHDYESYDRCIGHAEGRFN